METLNGAKTLETSNSLNLDFFFNAPCSRGKDLSDLFIQCLNEDKELALRNLLYLRDCREGCGERLQFRNLLPLALNYLNNERVNALIDKIVEIGRYDDLFAFEHTVYFKNVIEKIKEQLLIDLDMNTVQVSLLAKWLPSENTSNRETVKLAKKLRKALNLTSKKYRQILSHLRKKIKIVENNLREKDYTFDYSTLPSKAFLKYQVAFKTHDNERYSNFIEDVKNNKAKVNLNLVEPYEIIHNLHNDPNTYETLWKNLPNYVENENALCIVDTSGSMSITLHKSSIQAVDVALAFGLYFSERNTSIFKDIIIPFSRDVQLLKLEGSIQDRLRQMETEGCGLNTNLNKVFKLLLNFAVANKCNLAEMPKKIYIISDMEFDKCNDNDTNFENAKRMFESEGFKLPQIVFWNVNSHQVHVPITSTEENVMLISGFSSRLFKYVVNNEKNPINLMLEVLNNDRYAI